MNKKLNNTLYQLVTILNDGQYHDGNALGEQLGISRSAVWKAIQKLIAYDVVVESDKRKGYMLATPLVLLDEGKLKASLPDDVGLVVFESVISTNDYLRTLSHVAHPELCLAEHQTQGRGRLSREWVSPFAQNIYFSCRYPVNKDISELAGLSLVVGLAVLSAIKAIGVDQNVYAKWPNDILFDQKKLAGILIDVQAESNGRCDAIIGIGVNVNMLVDDAKQITQPWTSLQAITGSYIDRNDVAKELTNHLFDYLQRFIDCGLKPFLNEWLAADCLQGRTIILKNIDQTLSGKVIGVNNQGHLLLQLADGEVRVVSSGEATIK